MSAETQGSSVTYHTLQMANDLQDVGVHYWLLAKSVPLFQRMVNT